MPAPPRHEHDGFYLSGHFGVGYLHASNSRERASGDGTSLGIAMGAIVVPNLAVYGTLFGVSVADPGFRFEGGSTATLRGATASLGGLGVGATYYLMPLNLYFSAAIAATTFELEDVEVDKVRLPDRQSSGVGLNALIGKEWWVSEDWGLGMAGQLLWARMKEDAFPERWTGLGFSLLFSATYN